MFAFEHRVSQTNAEAPLRCHNNPFSRLFSASLREDGFGRKNALARSRRFSSGSKVVGSLCRRRSRMIWSTESYPMASPVIDMQGFPVRPRVLVAEDQEDVIGAL